MTKDEIEQTQISLNKLGYKLDVDGYWGTKTDAAYKDYKAKQAAKPKLDIGTILKWLPTILSLSQGKLNMNSDQFQSLVRAVMQVAAGIAVAKGVGDGDLWVIITGAVTSLGTYAWSHYFHKAA